jgi:hypothetical protein
MNERIRELAEQATDKWLGGEFFDREKFAQLIVKECIIKAEEEKVRFFAMHEITLGFCMENFQNLLKQDFGIKE